MSDPGSPDNPSPVLDPVEPPAPQPAGPHHYAPTQPAPRRRGRGWLIVLLILLGLGLIGSVVLNFTLLSDFGSVAGGAAGMKTTVFHGGRASQTVALYTVEGIIDGRAATEFRQFHNAVAHDSDVRAVVLRVNSPGGGVTSSDQICEMVKSLRGMGKRVVVSMGSMATSGGYYISAPADEIYAEITTVTGSIGVIAWWVALEGTFDKIGAEAVVIKSRHADGWKDAWGGFSPPHDYQRKHIQNVLDKMQQRFEAVVTTGRGKRLRLRPDTYTIPGKGEGRPDRTIEETEPFNGKIYMAEEARKLGLIDAVGYQSAAIDRAAKLARLDSPKVVRYSRRRTFMETLLRGRSAPSMKLDIRTLDQLQTPRIMMLWKVE